MLETKFVHCVVRRLKLVALYSHLNKAQISCRERDNKKHYNSSCFYSSANMTEIILKRKYLKVAGTNVSNLRICCFSYSVYLAQPT